MSDRKGHYLKSGKGATVPAALFSVAVSHRVLPQGRHQHIEIRELDRVWVSVSYHRRGRWSDPETAVCESGSDLREWMHAHALARRVNWVVAPIASDALTLTGWWEYVDRVGCRMSIGQGRGAAAVERRAAPCGVVFTAMVVRGTPDIVGCSYRGISWRWVSGLQYDPSPEDAGRAHRTAARRDRDARDGDAGAEAGRTEARCLWWGARIRSICDWWLSNARTPFSCTTGQLALGLLRSNQTDDRLCTHSDADVHRLERKAAHGGRASVWYVGNIGQGLELPEQRYGLGGECHYREVEGPIHHMDVRSMYPHLLGAMSYPIKYLYYRENVSPRRALDAAAECGVIADVTIETRRPEYPHRAADRISYPVGRFATTLTGPELLRLSDDGALLKVHRMAVYKMGRPFTLFSERLLAMRVAARNAGRTSDESFAKLLANSLAGKLAQRRGTWERDATSDEPRRWGESFSEYMDSGTVVKRRHIAGLGWRWSDDETGAGPYTFAFAYLCAYGRLMMRDMRGLCPDSTIVSQDTDAIWCLPPAYDTLMSIRGLVGEEPGRLSNKGKYDSARFWSPRHYHTDGRWTLSGFHLPRPDPTGLRVEDEYTPSLWASRTPRAPTTVRTIVRTSTLRLDVSGGIIGPDGWVEPEIRGRHLSGDE